MSLAKTYEPTGGLSAPDIRLYQLASPLRYIAYWIKNDNDSVCLDLESLQVKRRQMEIKASFGDNMIINTTIKHGDI